MAKNYVDVKNLGIPRMVEHGLAEFCRGLIDVYHVGVRAIIVYGSVARREYFPGRSDVNVLIVISDASLENLAKAVEVVHKGREEARITPFFLTLHDIETSQDVFPIKFLDMQDAYHLAYGEDVLEELHVNEEHLRLEVEQEMKILMLELRQFYLQRSRKRGPAGSEHLLAYFNSFLYLLKRLLKLQGVEPPKKNEELLDLACERYQLDKVALGRLLDYKQGMTIKDACAEAIPLSQAIVVAADIVDELAVETEVE